MTFANNEKYYLLKVSASYFVEARIHFALNCGAKSCPPIKTFTAQDLESQLVGATEAYLESEEDAVKVLMPKESGEKVPIIYLSMLFKWYAEDFGSSKTEILKWISHNMADESSGADISRKEKITQIINENNSEAGAYKIKYIPYDWGNNAKKK